MIGLQHGAIRHSLFKRYIRKTNRDFLFRFQLCIRIAREIKRNVICRYFIRSDIHIIASCLPHSIDKTFRRHHGCPHLDAHREGSLRRAHEDLCAVAHRHRLKIHRRIGLLCLLRLEIGREGGIRIDCRDVRNKDSVRRNLHAVFRPVNKFVAVLRLCLGAGQNGIVRAFLKSFRLLRDVSALGSLIGNRNSSFRLHIFLSGFRNRLSLCGFLFRVGSLSRSCFLCRRGVIQSGICLIIRRCRSGITC